MSSRPPCQAVMEVLLLSGESEEVINAAARAAGDGVVDGAAGHSDERIYAARSQ